MSDIVAGRRITLSLISHTNVGKTTLARTLLRRDIGEVADQPHVTDVSEAHTLIETPDGLGMTLWDTPGFGDTAHLLKRLRASRTPIGWLLSQVWDRFRDRPLWCSQQAVRNVQADADVVLYLVNATEDPAASAYVGMELQILDWIGKPVVVLLNQLGPPHDPSRDREDMERWRSALSVGTSVRAILALDAFARCWVQEGALLDTVTDVLPGDKQGDCRSLAAAWRRRNLDAFAGAMRILASQIALAARDREPIGEEPLGEKLRRVVVAGRGGDDASSRRRAMAALASRLDRAIVESTNRLIALHGLEGEAAQQVLERIRENYTADTPVDANLAAVLGGFVSGALGGLAADLAAGGLTFGGGIVAGGVLGAFGAAGLAKGYNVVRGAGTASLRWSPGFLHDLVKAALLRYLAVAHFGRGRGRWQDSEAPEFWKDVVEAAAESRRGSLEQALRRHDTEADEVLSAELTRLARDVLVRLYPESATVFEAN